MELLRDAAPVAATIACGTLLVALLIGMVPPVGAAEVFINEIHYDNVGLDSGEAVEVAGPAETRLDGWRLVLYNGRDGRPYREVDLAGTLPDQGAGFGTQVVHFPRDGIQNGSPDGIALVDAAGSSVELLAYEGSFEATQGPAAGRVAVDIGVSEPSTSPGGFSLQRWGSGNKGHHFVWTGPLPESFGAVNAGQSLAAPVARSIPEIQAAGHSSPHLNQIIATSGIVTAVDSNGFYLQDPIGDADSRSADGIFVFTGDAPQLQVGDHIELTGRVTEFTPGGVGGNGLSVTELTIPDVKRVVARGVPLPEAISIGALGANPPTETIEDDGFAVFDPTRDGIDYYESLEGMRVHIRGAVAVAPTTRFDEIWVIAGAGATATHRNARGGLTRRADDAQPERIQLQRDSTLTPGSFPRIDVGDRLGDVTGVMSYRFGNYEVLATTPVSASAGGLTAETTQLEQRADRLRVASFNLQNLHPGEAGRTAWFARQIVQRLLSPDILGLQEVADNDGPIDNGVVSASETYRALIEAIQTVGGPRYDFTDFAPEDGQDGGKPGFNIRVGFLFRPGRVELEPGSTRRLPGSDPSDGDAFASSRKPLVATFSFHGRRVLVVNNHFTSRLGGSPLFGAIQPPVVGGAARRSAQARVVSEFVANAQAVDADAKIIVLGDLNELPFGEALGILSEGQAGAGRLADLGALLPEDERYTFVFDGMCQQLDHMLVTHNLVPNAEFDIVHMNAEFQIQASDHDPILARLEIRPVPEPAERLLSLTGMASLLALARIRRRYALRSDSERS